MRFRIRLFRQVAVAPLALALLAALAVSLRAAAADTPTKGRIFILIVCDGLRPDLVTRENMPNLYAMAKEGVRFDRHHSLFPTLTMVNASALSTGAPPAVSGVMGNVMFWKPLLGAKAPAGSPLATLAAQPRTLEDLGVLERLNGPGALEGRLLALDTIAQETEREGGYIAALGKTGPAFLFDNRAGNLAGGRDIVSEPHNDFLLAVDELIAPPGEAKEIAARAKPVAKGANVAARDSFYTTLAIERALPAARAASEKGRPALIVLWMRDPDATQHRDGLGTLSALQALAGCDANIGRVRRAIAASGVEQRTDLMVVSDHGFATIRERINLAGLLVGAGIKQSADSTDIVVARNGASDLIYLSPSDFADFEARRAVLQKIVDFAEAQEWCGPIFSREAALEGDGRRRHASNDYLGWIPGTFSEASVGIYNPSRSPDLVISFREFSDRDNAELTGPTHPAFEVDAQGQHAVPNRSRDVVHPVQGVTYADVPDFGSFAWSSGMGMHGAAGKRQLHNFCAAIGPDFREHYVDPDPTGNADVAVTISEVLGLEPNVGPGGVHATGRVMREALSDGGGPQGGVRPVTMTAVLDLQGVRIVSRLKATELGRWLYLDDSNVEHIPLGRSP